MDDASDCPPGATAGAPDDASASGRYLYGCVRAQAPREFGAIGLGGQRVYTVVEGELAAVVSDVAPVARRPLTADVEAHERVIAAVMAHDTIVPLRFGSVLRSAAHVAALLASAREPLGEILTRLDGKVELGVRIMWDYERALARLAGEDEELRRLRAVIGRADLASTYLARRHLGRHARAALEERRTRVGAELHERLKRRAVATRSGVVTDGGVLLDTAFLVERARVEEFAAEVDAVRAHTELVTVNVTGPWPPYSFVSLRVALDGATLTRTRSRAASGAELRPRAAAGVPTSVALGA